MAWGDAFADAWSAATDAAKAGASKVASGAQWLGQKSADAARLLAEAAKQRADAVAAYTARLAEAAKAKLEQAVDAARGGLRDGLRTAGDRGFDALGQAGEAARQAKQGVVEAYDKARKMFGAGKVAAPVQKCPGTGGDGAADADRDGWLMSPQGPGKDCLATPPGDSALSSSRAAAFVSPSACCNEKRAAGAPTRDIIYVNGINTDARAHCETLNAIAAQTCGRVVGVYNATEGGMADAAQTGQDRRLIKQASAGKSLPISDGRNPAVDTLAATVTDEIRDGRTPEIWAHSQGGAVTSLALYDARNRLAVELGSADPLAGVAVKSFGSAAPKWVDGPTYEHFIHVNDATPSLFGLGHSAAGDALHAGAGAVVRRFSGDPASAMPFAATPDTGWLPALTSNHGVEQTYLKMEKQLHGGCP